MSGEQQIPDTQPVNPQQIPATPAAVAHAEEVGVDLTQVEGTGAGGQITKADVEAAAPAAGPEKYYYCMEEGHPGVPAFSSEPLNVGRIYASTEDVPVCPACGRQTNSIPCDGPDIPPEYVLELQQRFGR